MRETITITRKGQTTLPVEFRRLLGLSESGGVLRISLDEAKGEITIAKAVTPGELSERLSGYIKPGAQPVLNVSDYYQENRRHGNPHGN